MNGWTIRNAYEHQKKQEMERWRRGKKKSPVCVYVCVCVCEMKQKDIGRRKRGAKRGLGGGSRP